MGRFGEQGIPMALPGTSVYSNVFRHSLDDKNRLTIPSVWRWTHSDSETFLAIPNPGGYIKVLPPARVARLLAQIADMKLSDEEAEAVKSKLFGSALQFTFDKQGRFGVSPELLQHAGIVKEAVLGGLGDTFNIYSPARWDAMQARTAGENYGDLMRRIGL
jgi:MraZ protein